MRFLTHLNATRAVGSAVGTPPHHEVSSRPFVRSRVERKRTQQGQTSVAQAKRSDRKGHDASTCGEVQLEQMLVLAA